MMFSKLAAWWLRRKNLYLAQDLVCDLFPLLHVSLGRSRSSFYKHPPQWFKFLDFQESVRTDWLDVYDLALSFGNDVLLSIPSDEQFLLSGVESHYKKCALDWSERGLITRDQYSAISQIWRFIHWRYPQPFLDSHGLEVYSLKKITSSNKRQEERLGEFFKYEDALTFLKLQVNNQALYWGRPAQDQRIWSASKSELSSDFVEKSEEKLLALWRTAKEPTYAIHNTKLITAFSESQAKSFYKAVKASGTYQFYEIDRRVKSVVRNSLSLDRLGDYKEIITKDVYFENSERECLREYFLGSDVLSQEALRILISKIDYLENYA